MASSLFRYRREKCSFVSPFVASLFLFPPFPVRYVARSSTTLNDAAINNAHCECTKIYYATSIIRYRFLKTRLFSFSFFSFFVIINSPAIDTERREISGKLLFFFRFDYSFNWTNKTEKVIFPMQYLTLSAMNNFCKSWGVNFYKNYPQIPVNVYRTLLRIHNF